MEIMVVVLSCSAMFYVTASVLQKFWNTIPSPVKTAPPEVKEQKIVLRKTLVDVEPAPLKVIAFAEGKYDARLVMHGPYEGVVTRLLMLWKGDKYRSVKLEALCGINDDSVEEAHKASLEEAKEVAQRIYGKKNRAKVADTAEQVAPQPKAVAPPVHVQAVAAEQQVVTSKPMPHTIVSDDSAAIVKGFKAQYVGSVVEAGMQKHVTTRNGHPEEYETFTLTLDTPSGPERITGNDLRRAIAAAKVGSGDSIRVIYLKDIELSNGFKKKSYEIVRLAGRPA